MFKKKKWFGISNLEIVRNWKKLNYLMRKKKWRIVCEKWNVWGKENCEKRSKRKNWKSIQNLFFEEKVIIFGSVIQEMENKIILLKEFFKPIRIVMYSKKIEKKSEKKWKLLISIIETDEKDFKYYWENLEKKLNSVSK